MRCILTLAVLLIAPSLYAQQTARTPAQLRADLVHPRVLAKGSNAFAAQQDQQRVADAWLAEDKAKHLAVSFLWTVGTQYALEDKFNLSEKQGLPLSVASGVAVSVSKEFYDWQYKTGLFSRRDLVADAIGIGAASAFIWL